MISRSSRLFDRRQKVDVTSAVDFSSDQKKALATVLAKKYPQTDFHFEFHVDPEIIGGVCLKTEGRILDASFRKKLTDLSEYLFDSAQDQDFCTDPK